MALFVVADQATASVIVGPTSDVSGTQGGSGNNTQGSFWGIQFTANKDSVLVSFDFSQRGSSFGTDRAGSITLNDITSSKTVDTWDVPHITGAVANTLSFSANDALHSGDVYQLFYTQTAGVETNEVYAYIYGTGYAPYYNADITVTNGFENNSTSTGIWYAFNNITTVPEPSTFAMLGLGGLVLAIRRRQSVV
ncbi:MAG: PEP-CTERM sorting domain-containing protein [Schlesneria sp.]